MSEQKKTPTMSMILASSQVKELSTSLKLTNEQDQRARATALELSTNNNLKDCSPMSLIKYCFETARYNFTEQGYIYPVPYMVDGKMVCQTQVGWKGYRELAYRSGKYNKISANVVKSCDSVIRNEETGEVKVKFETDYNKTLKADIIGYYAFAKDKNNKIIDYVFMSKEECENHGKHFSKTYNSGAWKNCFDAMALKTVIKKLCNNLDKTPEMRELIAQDQAVYTEKGREYIDNPNNDSEITPDNDIIDIEVDNK